MDPTRTLGNGGEEGDEAVKESEVWGGKADLKAQRGRFSVTHHTREDIPP